MEPSDVDDFLAHYGVKGMKWGVSRSSPQVQARKTGRRENVANLKSRYTEKKSNGKTGIRKGKAAGTVLDVMTTGGMYTGTQIARSAGYTKGQSIALGMLTGPVGATLASELRVRKNARSTS